MRSVMKRGMCVGAAVVLLLGLVGRARCEESWRAAFEQTCSKTSQAMTLSTEELKTLLDKCDALQKIVETQEESVRKVYLKRLQLCRNLYSYMLEYKKNQTMK